MPVSSVTQETQMDQDDMLRRGQTWTTGLSLIIWIQAFMETMSGNYCFLDYVSIDDGELLMVREA